MPQFHFTAATAPPDEQLYSDIQQLNPMSDRQLTELIDVVMGFLSAQTTDLLAALNAFAEKHGVSPAALKGTVRGLFYVCRRSTLQ